jgi:predicted RNase H-like HicB family nuclease
LGRQKREEEETVGKHFVSAEEYRLPLHVELLPEGKYLATSKALPGLVAQGETVAETVAIAQDVAKQIIALIRDTGGDLPRSLKAVSSRFEIETAVAI